MKPMYRIAAFALSLTLGVGSLAAPLAARASEEGKRNTALALGAAAAGLFLTQKNKLPGIIAAGGAAYAYKEYDDSIRARHRREQDWQDRNDYRYNENRYQNRNDYSNRDDYRYQNRNDYSNRDDYRYQDRNDYQYRDNNQYRENSSYRRDRNDRNNENCNQDSNRSRRNRDNGNDYRDRAARRH